MKRMRGNGDGRKEAYLWAAEKSKKAKMGIYD